MALSTDPDLLRLHLTASEIVADLVTLSLRQSTRDELRARLDEIEAEISRRKSSAS